MLLERDDLLATLGKLLERARSGNGTLALVAGEAGSGKTSVTRELTTRVVGEAVVLWGACDPLSTPRPLSPLHDFAADPDSGLSGLLNEHVGTVETFGMVLARLKGTLRPMLMVVEDLHWADEGSSLAVPTTAGEVTFCRISHFGGFLRLVVALPEGAHIQVVASLNLKA